MLGLVIQSSPAVILKGSGDPAYNTTPPTGALADSGWQFQGQWGGFLGTPVAPQYFIAAKHVGGSVGQDFVYGGVTYHTTDFWDDTNSDLRIWKVDGVFPSYASLYTQSDELGKPLVVFGRGTQRGEEIFVNTVRTNYTTNVVNLKALDISTKDARKEFPDATFKGGMMTVVSSDVVTNAELKGWKFGPGDGVMRWGENQVISSSGCLVASFDTDGGSNEAFLSGGDSSGAVFIQENGVWKLAGINYAIEGPFGLTCDDPGFYGAIFDQSGLYHGSYLFPDDGHLKPVSFYASRISAHLPWIQSVIYQ